MQERSTMTRGRALFILFGVPFIVGGVIIGLAWLGGLMESGWCAAGVLALAVLVWGIMTSVMAWYLAKMGMRK